MSNSNLITIHGAEIRMILLWLLNSTANERNVYQKWNDNFGHVLIRSLKRCRKYFQTHDKAFIAKDAFLRSNIIFEFNVDLYKSWLRLHTIMPKTIDFIRNDPANHQIIIIGAGMAGLGAALTLCQNGYKDIKMLEAEEEPGGRLKTIQLENGFIELGAQWIHGKENNCLYKIAEEHNLISDVTSTEGCGLYIRDDGYIFDTNLVSEVRLEIEKIMSECEKFVHKLRYPNSFGEFLEEGFQRYLATTSNSKNILTMKEELFDWHIRFLLVDNSCCSLNDISAKEWGRYVDGNENVNLKNGYKSLINVLLQMLPNQILSCGCPVSKIIWSDTNHIQVYCVNGQMFECDHVIMTASLGYLKNIDNLFQPPLPYKLQKSIKSMGFYGIAKIFLIFKCKWWNVNGFQLIWRKSTKFNKLHMNWTRSITGFDVVYNQPNILLGWVSGEGVLEMEKLSESEIGTDCVLLLQTFLNRPIPNPIKVIRSNWMSSPWFRGGYSHISPQCDEQKTGPTTLSEPVVVQGVPKILLAGEACSPSHFSTTHGAFESGQAQAQLLINYLK